MKNIENIKIEVPAPVGEILSALKSHGYEAYIVGGCVRDALLGREPGDWDITTSALPGEVKAIFRHTVDTGIQHGTVMVLKGGTGYEVTTYRIDGEYKDSRHPEKVTFTRSLEEDLKRRDFTINAFAWDEEGLIDMFNGIQDLENRVIRCVGDPDQRFTEDALRIMRAVRFSAQLGFDIDPGTLAAIRNHAERLANISMERIRVEWEKTILSDNPCFVNKYADLGMARYIVSGVYDKCFDSNKDGLILEICRRRKEYDPETYRRLIMAAFCDNLTPDETREVFRYLKYDNRTRDAVVNIIRYKDAVIPADRVAIKLALNKMGKETFLLVLKYKEVLTSIGTGDADCVMETGGEPERTETGAGQRPADPEVEENAANTWEEKRTVGSDDGLDPAAMMNKNDTTVPDGLQGGESVDIMPRHDEILKVMETADDIFEKNEPYSIAQLAVNGSDLIAAGVPAGKKVGEILENILQKVIQSPTLNNREILCNSVFLGGKK